ncbi:MAG: ribonuclease H-like domain-containing protein [Candidatus Eisenbacteria bacterium]|uniref:Ribonuclease H-like domain-containing protein n=1 Tax=Eiseniibacteriota bacterium TaxID=2212470 RepID=A0A7Y2E8F9_UNCEI|nr:ribonuclease H-like domain-containing protein [Candidatus Eisenbacteria bacterium]
MISEDPQRKSKLAVLDALRNRRKTFRKQTSLFKKENSPRRTEKTPSPIHATELPGREEKNALGTFLRWEQPLRLDFNWLKDLNQKRNELWPQEQNALEALPQIRASDLLFFDLETCGFAGTPLFLVGCLVVHAGEGRLVQFLARHYGEEAAVVLAASDLMGRHGLWISFNGRSYDSPFFADRCRLFGLEPPQPLGHLDLLHASRRRWKHDLPNCRLGTLERFILGLKRPPDTPGSQVPAHYHEFVKKGEVSNILSILRHNAQDLKSLALLMGALPLHKQKQLSQRMNSRG